MCPIPNDHPRSAELILDQSQPESESRADRPHSQFHNAPSQSHPTDGAVASRSPWLALGAISVVVAGIGLAAWYGVASRPPAEPAPAVAAVAEHQRAFPVGKADLDPKATELLKSMLSGEADATTATLDGLNVVNAPALQGLAETSPQMADEIRTGRRELYRIYLLDFLAQDGDHLDLSVDGISFGDVYLQNAGTSYLIPLTPGVPVRIKLTATADGGGGVTVGFISSLGEARTDVLQTGEFEQWQIMVK